MWRNQPKFKYAFFALDIVILTISFWLAFLLVFPDFLDLGSKDIQFYLSHFYLYTYFLMIYCFCFANFRLYNRNIVIVRFRQLVLSLKALLIGSVVAVVLMVVSNMTYFTTFGKVLLSYFLIFTFIQLILFRIIIARKSYLFLAKKHLLRSSVLIVGADKSGQFVGKTLAKAPSHEFLLAGFLDDYKDVGAKIYGSYENLGKLIDLPEVINQLDVDEIIIAIDNAPYFRLITIVEECLKTGKVVRVYSNLLSVIAEKMNVELYANIPVIMLSQFPLEDSAWMMKRVIDMIVSTIALVLLSPLFAAIAIGIKLSSRGPVIFKQVRIGKGGRPFNFYKFRSMHLHADDSIHKNFVRNLIQNHCSTEEKEMRVFKITEDPRIFSFGKLIRKTSFDEFPQLLNVLKGDMTLVGPRPCLPYEWECYSEWHKARLMVTPGCTGLWQVVGRSSVTFEEMVILDLYYISNMTAWFDFKIVMQTFPVIFLGAGAH